MTPLSDEGIDPWNIRQHWAVQLPHRANNGVCNVLLFNTILVDSIDAPRLAHLIKHGAGYFCIESKVLLQLVLIDNPFKILLQLFLLRKILRPMVCWLKGVAVQMIADVDPCARVAIFKPGAAHCGILLDNHKGNPCLLQAIGC